MCGEVVIHELQRVDRHLVRRDLSVQRLLIIELCVGILNLLRDISKNHSVEGLCENVGFALEADAQELSEGSPG